LHFIIERADAQTGPAEINAKVDERALIVWRDLVRSQGKFPLDASGATNARKTIIFLFEEP
jgi:hypothetical protein